MNGKKTEPDVRNVAVTRRPGRNGKGASQVARVDADAKKDQAGRAGKRRDRRTSERSDGRAGHSAVITPTDVFAGYSVAQLNQITDDMRRAANKIYLTLVGCSVHAFIEFNGLHQKYVDLCERAAREGIDFTMANKHNAVALPLLDHDVEYLAEKFACIFGPSFKAHPALWTLFKHKVESGT